LPLGSKCSAASPFVRRSGLEIVCLSDLNHQTLQESVVVSALYSLGLFGLYAMLMSTRSVYTPSRAFGLVSLGVLMMIVFLGSTYLLLTDKIGPIFH